MPRTEEEAFEEVSRFGRYDIMSDTGVICYLLVIYCSVCSNISRDINGRSKDYNKIGFTFPSTPQSTSNHNDSAARGKSMSQGLTVKEGREWNTMNVESDDQKFGKLSGRR